MKKTTRFISVITLIAMIATVFAVVPFAASAATLYTVSFDANGGGGTMADVPFEEEADYTLPSNAFTAPVNHVFDKWDIDGDPVAPGDIILVDADITVKAVWKEIDYAAQISDLLDEISAINASIDDIYDNELVAIGGDVSDIQTTLSEIDSALDTINTTLGELGA